MQNQIQHGTYIRNGFGVTFQVLFIDKNVDHEFTFLKPIDSESNTLRMASTTFKALFKNKNYVIVKNPNSIHERLLGKQIGYERFLVK
jgi:hypothetical protein